jgi:hypothetical protein
MRQDQEYPPSFQTCFLELASDFQILLHHSIQNLLDSMIQLKKLQKFLFYYLNMNKI